MPFYDLKCNKCNEEFNVMAKISEREKGQISCPKCDSNSLSALFNNVNIILSRKSESAACPNINRCGGCCGR